MNRPLIRRRIDELEAMFEAEQEDRHALHLLQAELAFRSVPRAATLLSRVERVLAGGTVVAASKQSTLSNEEAPVPLHVPLLEEMRLSKDPPMPGMSIEAALKALKVTTSTPWESIETSRRQAVEHARPDRLASLSEEKRRAAKEEARIANAAYRVLLQARSA